MRVASYCLALATLSTASAATLDEAVSRLDADATGGKPLVAHVVVALCDNEFQGIVPVPAKLGNGDAPQSNLYWGAMYGVRGYFRNRPGWQALAIAPSTDPRVLDRVLYRHEVVRNGQRTPVLLLAEAWRGRNIADAVGYFLELNRGEHVQQVRAGNLEFASGGAAHVIAFVGHNGLMDFPAPVLPRSAAKPAPHASMVLACISDSYFTPLLQEHSVPLLMTTGLMAPEAYTLEAALTAWFAGKDGDEVRRAAAGAYARFQHSPEKSALRLFRSPAVAGLP